MYTYVYVYIYIYIYIYIYMYMWDERTLQAAFSQDAEHRSCDFGGFQTGSGQTGFLQKCRNNYTIIMT